MSTSEPATGSESAHLIYVGRDFCFRTPVLERAGYQVRTCASADQLGQVLDPSTDAVLLEQSDARLLGRLLSVTRSRCSASVVLFQDWTAEIRFPDFDLVIASPASPDQWLPDLNSLIERSRALRAETMRLKGNAAALQAQSTELVRTSVAERAQRQQARKDVPDIWGQLLDREEES